MWSPESVGSGSGREPSALLRFGLPFLGRLAADQFGLDAEPRGFLALFSSDGAGDNRFLGVGEGLCTGREFEVVNLDRAADLAVATPYWNPRPVERAGIRTLLDNAYFGRSPAA